MSQIQTWYPTSEDISFPIFLISTELTYSLTLYQPESMTVGPGTHTLSTQPTEPRLEQPSANLDWNKFPDLTKGFWSLTHPFWGVICPIKEIDYIWQTPALP